jgi:glycosyltransferase involved in cell wall biosynthesis
MKLRDSTCSSEVTRGKVLYVIGSLEIGGAERHVVSIATALNLRGWQVTVFTLSRTGPLLEALDKAEIPVEAPVLPGWLDLVPGSRIKSRLRAILSIILIVRHLRQNEGTISHFFLPASYIIGGIAAILANSRPRLMSRRSLNLYQKKKRIYGWAERLLHSRMDLLLGNSLSVVKQLQDEVENRCQVDLIYNGIEISEVSLDLRKIKRDELGLGEAALVFIVIANLIPYKGHRDLLEAFASVNNRLPSGWRCICIGRDDGIGKSLKDLSARLDLAENMLWLGARPDATDYLYAADVAVSASHEEGFSNAILEAMRAGLPVVATNVGGNPEAVEDTVTGTIVDSCKPSALGEAILKIANDPCRQEMGRRGRERLIERFSLDACIDAYERVYSKLS